MAWGSNTNPVPIGGPTRKVEYDDLWDKLQYVRTDVIPATTKMLFGQASAPQGWTKDTTTWTDDSMIVFVTGTPGSGGSADPKSFNLQWYDYKAGSENDETWNAAGSKIDTSGAPGVPAFQRIYADNVSNDPWLQIDCYTENAAPRYQEVIAATKDTYT